MTLNSTALECTAVNSSAVTSLGVATYSRTHIFAHRFSLGVKEIYGMEENLFQVELTAVQRCHSQNRKHADSQRTCTLLREKLTSVRCDVTIVNQQMRQRNVKRVQSMQTGNCQCNWIVLLSL